MPGARSHIRPLPSSSFDLNAFLLTLVVPRTSMHLQHSVLHIRLLYQSLVSSFFFVVYIVPCSLFPVPVPNDIVILNASVFEAIATPDSHFPTFTRLIK
ncbi:hypothetical protein FIBSPDRAFT_104965 [Athelia psychrophila]|uniref:Uncharacterized protein n=1 Tax=Athelia psychrophila TaxID=1759441 RepID=A0A166DAS5_9AGAM|nr:hypothetical protein FIBSPDRAFT_104965 [Fibularhizoctonia sp. CBS 109695]